MTKKRGIASGVLGKGLGRVILDDPVRDVEPDPDLVRKHYDAVVRLTTLPIVCPRCYGQLSRARNLPVPQIIARTCKTCEQDWSVHVRPQPDGETLVDFRPVIL